MSTTTAEARYQQVCRHARQTAVWSSVEAALGWDERTMLPSAGGPYRAEQMTAISSLLHKYWTDPEFVANLRELEGSSFGSEGSSDVAVAIRRLRRRVEKKLKLPQSLVEELARTAVLGQQAWEQARNDNDFPAFRPLLEKAIALKREEADALGYPQCPYDALLDDYEPAALSADTRSSKASPIQTGFQARKIVSRSSR